MTILIYLYSIAFLTFGYATASPYYADIGFWIALCNLGIHYSLFLSFLMTSLHICLVSPLILYYTVSGRGRRIREDDSLLWTVEFLFELAIVFNGLIAAMMAVTSVMTMLSCGHVSSWQCHSLMGEMTKAAYKVYDMVL